MTGWDLCRCPVCGGPVSQQGRTLRCERGHSFDLSAEGYVNLLQNAKAETGDGREMVAARRRFLEGGYYACLRDTLADLAEKFTGGREHPAFFDAGCGEGYYTAGVFGRLCRPGRELAAVGFDLSRTAVRLAARRKSGACFAVAGIFDLPVRDGCADMVLSVFAPVAGAEFARVLRPGGYLIVAAPGPRHLFGLKEVLYDRPYENEEAQFSIPGMRQTDIVRVGGTVHLTGAQAVRDLFAMTPYFWHTPADGIRRLEGVSKLETPAEFSVHVLTRAG